MRLVTNAFELGKIARLLPSALLEPDFKWQVVDKLPYEKRSDLLYFDVIDQNHLCILPGILRDLNEERCFIWNYTALRNQTGGQSEDAAIELLASDDKPLILRELGNEAPRQSLYLAVYHLVGLFGIVPESADWLILAEPDEHAVFLSRHEIKYVTFQSIWWPHVFKRIRTAGLDIRPSLAKPF